MRNFLQNLLLLLALALCGLVAVQWHREARLRANGQTLTDDLQRQRAKSQELDASVRQLEAEILRLSGLRKEATAALETNQTEVARLKLQLQKRETELEQLAKQADVYKAALERANGSIKSQNEELQKLGAERNEVVAKFNRLVADYNLLVKQWNEQQEQLSQQGTNHARPSPPPSRQ